MLSEAQLHQEGCDTSNMDNEEAGDKEVGLSDDKREAEQRRMRKASGLVRDHKIGYEPRGQARGEQLQREVRAGQPVSALPRRLLFQLVVASGESHMGAQPPKV